MIAPGRCEGLLILGLNYLKYIWLLLACIVFFGRSERVDFAGVSAVVLMYQVKGSKWKGFCTYKVYHPDFLDLSELRCNFVCSCGCYH